MADSQQVGVIAWCDLTVEDADTVRDFYEAVVGWQHQEVNMGEYSDYSMVSPGSDQPTAGVCHSRGVNAKIPPQWLIYVTVADLDKSLEAVKRNGGKLVTEPVLAGKDRFCVIQDPAGACMALYEKNA